METPIVSSRSDKFGVAGNTQGEDSSCGPVDKNSSFVVITWLLLIFSVWLHPKALKIDHSLASFFFSLHLADMFVVLHSTAELPNLCFHRIKIWDCFSLLSPLPIPTFAPLIVVVAS